MAFSQVNSLQERKALVDRYLKNRKILKKRMIDEKTGKQHFQEDVAQPLQKPVMTEINKKQNELIEKLQEDQNGQATTQTDIVNAIRGIP